jgi:outer membrane receptor protein involved in Fe transport
VLLSLTTIFFPGTIQGTEGTALNAVKIPESYALEYGLYLENEHKINGQLSLNYGLRYTQFSNIGPGTIYNFDDNFDFVDSTVYDRLDVFNTYGGFEPRISMTYLLNENSSLKASYSRTMQFVQLASNSTVGNPLSIWFPASPNVQPQFADQGAVGYFRNFKDGMFETSVEVFYKKMNNQIDFRDHAQLIMNPELEGELRFGYGEAYGLELFIRKNVGKITGWVSYTLSRSIRYFDDINDGKAYLSPFDRPHDFASVLSYEISKRWLVSATWVYSSGATATFPTGRFTLWKHDCSSIQRPK